MGKSSGDEVFYPRDAPQTKRARRLAATRRRYSAVDRRSSIGAISSISVRWTASIDAPDASTLGLHRALLYNDREGYMETFRPYARPGNDWLEEAAAKLKRPNHVSA